MHFAHPLILIGLLALAAPLLVHLVGRRRPRRVILPTARFADAARAASRGLTRLRQLLVVALRLAVVALAVLAAAGPRLGSAIQPGAGEADARPTANEGDEADARGDSRAVAEPVRVLVVDAEPPAAGDDGLRPATFVRAALPEGFGPYTVRSAWAKEADPGEADLVFWVGRRGPARPEAWVEWLERGGRLAWLPGEVDAPDASLATLLAIDVGPAETGEAGWTLLAKGGRALAPFAEGAAGDLGRVVFMRRLAFGDQGDQGRVEARFRDGRPAIVSRPCGGGSTMALAFGPSESWGDLAGHPEWVILVHGIVAACRPASEHQPQPEAEQAADPAREPQPSPADPADAAAWFALPLAALLALLNTDPGVRPRKK